MLTSHLFLPALRTKTFHHRNAQCITAKSTCRGPVWVINCRAGHRPSAAARHLITDTNAGDRRGRDGPKADIVNVPKKVLRRSPKSSDV